MLYRRAKPKFVRVEPRSVKAKLLSPDKRQLIKPLMTEAEIIYIESSEDSDTDPVKLELTR